MQILQKVVDLRTVNCSEKTCSAYLLLMALPPVVGAVAPITVAPGRDVVQLVPRFQLWRRGLTFTFI